MSYASRVNPRNSWGPTLPLDWAFDSNMEIAEPEEQEWHNGLCSHVCGGDCGSCWAAWCCPCFLFGRTGQRVKYFPDSSKEQYELFNGNCAILCGAMTLHLGWLAILLKRQDLRKMFNIKGNGCTDCLVGYFCSPCALAQMEMEIRERAEKAQRVGPSSNAATTAAGGYVPQRQMMYQAPPQL